MEAYAVYALMALTIIALMMWVRSFRKPRCLCKRSTCNPNCVRQTGRIS